MHNTLPSLLRKVEAADEPLLNRVPTVDEHGKPLGDLLILIPRLRSKSNAQIQQLTGEIHHILERFGHAVVFAELNVARNQLWVSVRPLPGIRATIAEGIRERCPEAKLVAHL